jgi:hypothetical protein
MKKAVFLALCVALALAVPGSANAGGRNLADLRAELEALTDAISTQMKLLEVMQRVDRPEQAAATKVRIRDLVVAQLQVLAEITVLLGGEAPRPAELPRVADLGDPPDRPSPNEPLNARKITGLAGGPSLPPRATTEVSKHIDLALDWLARHQDADGYWDTDGFAHRCVEEKCDGAGHALYDPGVTGLAALAFLWAGETHKHGNYQDTVRNALQYLKQIQDSEGCFGPRTTNHFTYNHAIAAQAMVTAYALTASPLFKQSAQLGIEFIEKARNPYLGWRYGVRPGDNDTSMTGWMTAALHAGKHAGLKVDDQCFEGARAWIDKATEPEYGRVGYTLRGSGPARPQDMMDTFPADRSESLTAVGIMVRLMTGEDPKKSELIQKGVDLILRLPPKWNTTTGQIDMYFWFWGTRALAEVGGKPFEVWSGEMSRVIATAQRTGADIEGSFDPAGPWGREGGRVYSTAMMALCAEILERAK